MRDNTFSIAIAICVTLAGLCFSQASAATSPASSATGVADVALRDGGVLHGQLLDPQGRPVANAPVRLMNGEQELAETRTDAQGAFAFRGLRGGVYQVAGAGGAGIYRLWAPGTAPPSARPGVLLVAGDDLVRGNLRSFGHCCGSWCRYHLSNPVVLTAVVATAIAVPVAIHNARDEKPVSPP